jgi:hypothetical protein
MLTIFSCPKAFRGNFAVIQRNAITSWTLLRPKPEIILIGDEEGVAEFCRELGLHHVREVARNEFGTPLVSDIFNKGQRMATHDLCCHVNSDIIFMSDFVRAVETVSAWRERFLMVGARWDLDVFDLLDFEPGWEERMRGLAMQRGRQRGIDFFVFPRGMLEDLPPFAIGRTSWDNWLIWRARSLRIPVVDASPSVVAIHQNHDYSHHPERNKWKGEERRRNLELAGFDRPGGWRHCYNPRDATHCLISFRIKSNSWGRRLEVLRRWFDRVIYRTRPIRHRLGLRRWKGKEVGKHA